MAKVGYGPKDFDPSDYQAAVRRVVDFLDEHVSAFEDLPQGEIYPSETWRRLVPVLSEWVEAAYQVAERSPPEFPVLLFMDEVVLRLEEMQKAIAKIVASFDGDGFEFINAERMGKWELHKLTRQIRADYPKFRSRLKLLARWAPPPPEAAPESERPAARRKPGRETKDLSLSVSDALLRRWNQRGQNAPKRKAWARDAARWLKDQHGAVAPDGELWSPEDVLRFLENAQERVRRKRSNRS